MEMEPLILARMKNSILLKSKLPILQSPPRAGFLLPALQKEMDWAPEAG